MYIKKTQLLQKQVGMAMPENTQTRVVGMITSGHPYTRTHTYTREREREREREKC